MSNFELGESQWIERLGNLRNLIRQELIARQLRPEIRSGMTVLDVGCGQGTQSIRLAIAGCRVTGVDPSIELLKLCSDRAARDRVDIELLRGRISDLDELLANRRFDLICCHGLFMYLDTRREPLRALLDRLQDGGRLSTTFRNGNALAMRPALRGQWDMALTAFDSSSYVNDLGVPAMADRPEDLEEHFRATGLKIIKWYGVRVLNDAISTDTPIPSDTELALLLDAEQRAGETDPYRMMGSQFHVIAGAVG
jgi:S-adenosylmethionine-dependent methyltransferase